MPGDLRSADSLVSRQTLEKWESEHLAPFAIKAGESRGRKYPEAEHPYRTAFQRDRDRIIHSSAFRRLQAKTQVFVYHEGDYYRTRLTHSLETAQIARTIARALGLNQDLCETLALAHDLGHPPFGHAGERAMNVLMAHHGGFNHNMQGLRIVEILEDRYPSFPGLNLTWEVREGIVKHTLDPHHPSALPYEPGLAATLETLAVDKSDEIAYNNHDLDDALTSRMIQISDLNEVDLWQNAFSKVEKSCGQGEERPLVHETIRTMINAEVTDLLHATLDNLRSQRISSLEAVRKSGKPLVSFSEEMSRKHLQLKEFLSKNLYQHYKIVQMTEKGKRVVQDLFRTFVEIPSQLPPHIRKKIGQEPVERVVCDYIVGMTDKFALDEHKRLFDPHERFLI